MQFNIFNLILINYISSGPVPKVLGGQILEPVVEATKTIPVVGDGLVQLNGAIYAKDAPAQRRSYSGEYDSHHDKDYHNDNYHKDDYHNDY